MKPEIHTHPADARSKWSLVLIPLVIAAAAFAFHVTLEQRFDTYEGFYEFNTFFGADPNKVIGSFGEGVGRQQISHPGLPFFFSVPLKGIVSVVAAGQRAVAQKLLRRELAMFIVPLAAALQCFAAYWVFVRLGLRTASAALLTLLGAVSFSKMMFGSMPETFCLSGLTITLAYLLALQPQDSHGKLYDFRWWALGVFGVGVTVTNIVPIGVLYWYGRRRRSVGEVSERGAGAERAGGWYGRMPAVARALVLLVAVVIAVFGVRSLGELTDEGEGPVVSDADYVTSFLVEAPASQALVFPSAVVNGLTPLRGVGAVRNELWKERRVRHDWNLKGFPYKFTMKTPRALSVKNMVGFALLALLTTGALRLRRSGHPAWPYCLASLIILAFNWVLHSFWGEEQFLYSRHWQFPLMVLVAGLFLAFERLRRFEVPALAAAVLYVGFSNFVAVQRIVGVMQTWFEGKGLG